MRVYLPAGLADMERLVDRGQVQIEGYLAASTDEEDELAALETAAEGAACVIVAEADDPDGPVSLDDVVAFHVDTDNSGDLAWFATQEIAAVLDLVRVRESR